jgi:hypothetical protein
MKICFNIPEGAYKALLENNPTLLAFVEDGAFHADKVDDPDLSRAAHGLMIALAHIVVFNVRNPVEQQSVVTAALRRVERVHPACLKGVAGVPLMS